MPLAAVCVETSSATMPRPAGELVPLPCRGHARAQKAPLADLMSILDALDIRVIQTTERRLENCTIAQNTLRALLAEHSAEHVVLVLRTITESEGNARALIEPVIKAVSAVAIAHPEWTGTGLRWIEAFDGLALLELYGAAKRLKKSAAAAGWSYLAGMLVLVLRDAFADQAPKKCTQTEIRQARLEREQAARERKAAALERANGDKIAFGRELIAARETGQRIDLRISGQPSKFVNVARMYGDRPAIWRAASWEVLMRLSSPTMAPGRRAEIERQIESGQRVSASAFKAAAPGAGCA